MVSSPTSRAQKHENDFTRSPPNFSHLVSYQQGSYCVINQLINHCLLLRRPYISRHTARSRHEVGCPTKHGSTPFESISTLVVFFNYLQNDGVWAADTEIEPVPLLHSMWPSLAENRNHFTQGQDDSCQLGYMLPSVPSSTVKRPWGTRNGSQTSLLTSCKLIHTSSDGTRQIDRVTLDILVESLSPWLRGILHLTTLVSGCRARNKWIYLARVYRTFSPT